MKTKILTLLLLCLPILLGAQNYEQQGDELFAQALYEKAEKKYSAAIEMSGASSSLQAKKEKTTKCAQLLKQAINAEESSNYTTASKLYADLYAIHALPTYKNKVDALNKKAKILAEQQYREKNPKEWSHNRIMRINSLINRTAFRSTFPSQTELMYELFLDRKPDGKWDDNRNLALKIEINNKLATIVSLRILHGNDSDLGNLLNRYINLGTNKILEKPHTESGVYTLGNYEYTITEKQIVHELNSYMDIIINVRKEFDSDITAKRELEEQELLRKGKKESDKNLPSGITVIKEGTIADKSLLKFITIPNSVTLIEEKAFFNFFKLEFVDIPESVKSIGNKAFGQCSCLKTVILHNGIVSIGNAAFYNCSSLQSIIIPNSVTNIGKDAFANCRSLYLKLPERFRGKIDVSSCKSVIYY